MDDHQEKKDGLFEIHRENIYFRWGLTAVIVIVVCIIAAQFITKMPAFFGYVKAFLGTLSPVLYGLGIAYLLHPIEDRIRKLLEPQLRKVLSEKKAAGMAKGIGIFASLVFAGLVIWALISMILPQLLESITTIIGNFPSYYNTLTKWVQEFINGSIAEDVTQEIMDQVYIYLKDFLTGTVLPKVQTILAGLTTSVVNIAKSMLNLIIGVIISIYLLSGKDKFLAQSKKLCYAGKKAGRLCVQRLHLCKPGIRWFHRRQDYRLSDYRHFVLYWASDSRHALYHADFHYCRRDQHHSLLWSLSGCHPIGPAAVGD